MLENKNVPKLRFNEFTDEWKKEKLGDKGNFFSGGTPLTSKSEFYHGKIPFIKSGEINNNKTEQYITELAIENSSAKSIQKGDLLFALYGATSGEVAIAKIDGAINQAVLNINIDANNTFLYNYFLKNKDKITEKYLQGGQGNLSSKIVKNLIFNFPTIKEQEKIADFLSLIDKKIELLEKKLSLYHSIMKYFFENILSKKLRFNDFNLPWKKCLLGDIAEINKGFTPKTSESLFWGGKINWLSIADMNQGKYIKTTSKHITDKAIGKKNIIKKGTLIMSFKLTIGKLGILKNDMFSNEAICNFIWKNDKINTEYMYYYLNQLNIKKYGSQAAKGITLNNETLNSIPIELPSIMEQEKIAQFLILYDKKIELIERKLFLYQSFKKSLLQKMFI